MFKRKIVFVIISGIILGSLGFSQNSWGQPDPRPLLPFEDATGVDGVSGNIGSSGEDGVNANTVPPWIKTSMQFWVEGHTTDAEFLSTVEFLANEEIIVLEASLGEPLVVVEDLGAVPTNTQESSSGNLTGSHFNVDSFFDIMLEGYTIDSFFDVFTELQESSDSFFDVFFEVETPRANECLRGQELVFDERTKSWQCASANTVDSFFDVFFDVATESSQNTEDITELERKIAELEKKIAELESSTSDTRSGY